MIPLKAAFQANKGLIHQFLKPFYLRKKWVAR